MRKRWFTEHKHQFHNEFDDRVVSDGDAVGWTDFFPNGSLSRGERYYRQRRVSNLTIDEVETGKIVRAEVIGSLRYRVEVTLRPPTVPEPSIESNCTCPFGAYCKHAVATMFEALDKDASLLDFWKDAATGELKRPPPKLSSELQGWLQTMDKAAAPAPPTDPNAYPTEEPQRLIYILDVQDQFGGPHCTVECVATRQLKRGGYGQGNPYEMQRILNQPSRFIRPADVLIARKIRVHEGVHAYGVRRLQADWGAEILNEILATGRCHWRRSGLQQPPLKLDSARPATPTWVTDNKGRQRPTFDVTPPANHVLPFSPPWYVDESASTCGPLETSLPNPVAAAWVKAPLLEPESAEGLTRALAGRWPDLAVPAPQSITVERIKDPKPVPCLRLHTVTLDPSRSFDLGGRPLREINLAHFSVDYDGHRIEANNFDTVISSFQENVVRRVHRDQAMEQASLLRLTQLGFQAAGYIFYSLHLGNHRDDLTLRTAEAWFTFVKKTVPKLRADGWRIEMEPNFAFHVAEPEDWYVDVEEGSGMDWFGLELGVQVDGQRINLLPVLLRYLQANPDFLQSSAMTKESKGSVPIQLEDGRRLAFPKSRLREMLAVLVELLDPHALGADGRLQLPKLRAAEVMVGPEWRWLGNKELRAFGEKLRDFRGIQAVEPPAELQATLRGYQQDGLNWLQFLREYDLAGILADDMGLGKTVQTLAHLLVEKKQGRADRPSLVVAPTSVLTNWQTEVERFAPSLRVLLLHGQQRKQHFERLQDYDLVLTSYPLLVRDRDVLSQQEFHLLVLDEAQFIKNPRTQAAQIVAQFKARHRLCLSGTPMENHLGELWSLYHFLLPGFLGDERRFRTTFRVPIEKQKDSARQKLLAQRVAPFLLRRTKLQVETQLPPKTEVVHNVELQAEQRDLYETIRIAVQQRVRDEVAKKGLSRAHIILLDALLKLRQVCCDPRLLKLDAARKVKESAKMELLMELLPELLEEGRRILLFSQFTSMLELIEAELDTCQIRYVKLTGETKDRATPIRQFQAGEVPLFLISLKAGGFGLNLTAADVVIHYDPWWNPAVENQATDRAHRIGQTKPVFVYKLMTVGTVEEKIALLQARKKELVQGLWDEKAAAPPLSEADLEMLFAPIRA